MILQVDVVNDLSEPLDGRLIDAEAIAQRLKAAVIALMAKLCAVHVEGDLTDLLRVGLAGRYENYSDFDATADGKVTVRLQLDRRFVVRGAVSTGFRAPSLGQSYFSTRVSRPAEPASRR